MEKDDKGSTMIRMGVSGWMFLLVPAYPGCPGSKAVKRSLLLLFLQAEYLINWVQHQNSGSSSLWQIHGALNACTIIETAIIVIIMMKYLTSRRKVTGSFFQKKISAHLQPLSLIKQHTCQTTQVGYIAYIDRHSGVLGGIRGYTAYTNLRVFLQRILTSVIINKQGTFRPFATPLCVYPPPFLAIHHWIDIPTAVMMSS